MNRVFKVIWNHTKGCYVVVAETAKNMTKRSSLSVVFSKMLGITACAVMLTGVMMPTDALGAPITRGTGATAENDGGIAVGERTNARGDYSVAMGTDATVGVGDPSESESQNGIAIGHNAKVTVNPATATPGITDKSGGIAIGHSAETRDINTIAIGTGTLGQGAQAVAIGRNANTIANNGVAIGNEAKVQSTNGFALGNNSRAGFNKANQLIGKDNDLAFGPNARAWGGTSMAFGNNAESGGGSAVAIGNKAYSMGDHGVALGTNAQSRGEEAPALGTNSTANGKYSVAVGRKSLASNEQDIAIGSGAQASGTNSLAVGSEAKATKNSSIAIGNGSESNGTSSAVIGSKNIVNSDDTYVWGTNNGTINSKFSSVMGNNNHLDTTEEGAHIMGNNSTVSAKGSMALGNWAYATAMDSFVMGNNARVDQANSVALGTNSTTETVVSTPNATVNGVNKTFAGGTAQGTVSIGANNVAGVAGIKKYYRTLTNLAAGRIDANSTDAINGSQLHAVKEEVERGLNFDANTGGAKNNKLGSKVTIKGDGSNINTAITQANGDTTINMTLGNTVTIGATNPVTINGTTGHVTGLQNKDWNVDSPVAVSGRAATEDQLKKVNDKVNTNKDQIDKNKQAITDNKQNITNNAGNIAQNKQDISTINTKINKGLNFAGDTGAVSNRKLGDTVTVKGGATGTLSDGNIGVESDGNGTLNLKLAKTLTGLESVTAGGTTINNDGLTVGGKTYVTPNGIDANNQKITNVADGSNPNDAVNYGQLQKAINGTAKASTVKAKDANVTVTEGTNAAGGKEYTVGLGNKITVGTTNPVTVDGDTGHVTDLTNTDWNVDNPVAVSGRAATEDQLKKVNDKVNTNKSAIDKNAGDIANNTQNINKNKQDISDINKTLEKGLNFAGDTGAVSNRKLGDTVTIKGGADAAKLSDNNIGVVSDGNGTLNVKLAKELQGLTSTTFTNGGNNTVINGDGMTINPAGGNKVSLTKDGLNNGGNKITNVANGTDPMDAVNKSQLDNATAKASTTVSQGSNITVTPSDNANGSKNYEVSLKDQVTLGKDAGKQVSFDGTNGTIKAGDKVTIDGKDGKIAAGKVAVDGKDGYVTGLENKDWDPDNITSGRAATEDQLQKSHKSLDNKITNLGDEITKKGMNFAGNTGEFHRDLGQKVTIKGEGTESDNKYSGENIKTVAENGNVTIKMAKDLKTDSVTTDKVKVGKNGQDGVSITGPNGADGTDGKVGITGKDGKDAVSMSGKDGVGHIGLTGKDGRNADITVDKGDPDLNGNDITRIKYQDENGKTHQVATKDDGMKYGGDSGSVIKKKLNEQVNVVGGITDASKLTSEDNLGVVSDGSNNLKVRMAKDLKGLETVTTKDADGNTTVMNGGGVTITPAGGNQVSLTKDGLDNGGNTISNVGPGVNGTDAVNVNQLKDATDGLSNAINAVAGETQRVGAHAAALSALKPIQYDPLEPTQVMAGIGNYRGETAAALGIAHYTAEDTMFHVGMSVGSHHNMVNAGVTRKFGTSDAKKAVPERYKGGPISSIYVLQDEVTALKAENVRMQESLNELSSVKDDNARMQQRIDELSSVKEDNEQMKAQIALLMQQAGLTK